MPEFRLVTSSDEHLADQTPGFRKDDYRAAILSKLEWQGSFAKRFEANAFLRGGDFFHVKAANKTTMRTMAMAARIHRRFPCPTYAMAGNHDMSNNDPATVPGQPLGVLLESHIFNLLRDESFEAGSSKIRVVGVEYTTDLDVDGLHNLVRKKDENYTVAFVHALAAMAPNEKIQSFFHERIFDYRDLIFDGCPDVYVFGHYHKDQGIVDHLGVKFVNLGAVSRGALTFENLERKPKIASIKFNSQGVSVEEHIIPHADALDVFDLDRKKKLESVRHHMNEFISKLHDNSALVSDDAIEARKKELSKFPADVQKLALELMEASEAGTADE
jgi:DNA repair exonuclease SbcCD nuclease subunit